MATNPDQKMKRGRKHDQVLDGARKVFLRNGFERASVDDIAREAGVSKATIYAYFTDKSRLFLEVARAECERQASAVEAMIDSAMPVGQALTLAAERIVSLQLSDFSQRMFRIVVSEGERFPGLGRQFHDFGPGLACQRLARLFADYVSAGQLQIDDVDLAADQFSQLCKTTIQERLVFGMSETVTPEMIQRSVKGTVEMFLARYGVGKSGQNS